VGHAARPVRTLTGRCWRQRRRQQRRQHERRGSCLQGCSHQESWGLLAGPHHSSPKLHLASGKQVPCTDNVPHAAGV
jgi:hypothetical protein